MLRHAANSSDPSLLFDRPSPARRKWINCGIALFLTSQIAIPLTYYLYKEPTNERFAWRMFSSVHMSEWNRVQIIATAHRGGRTVQQIVPVESLLVESSWKNLYSAQPDFRDKFLRRYLEESGADELAYQAQGVWPSGEPMQPIRAVIRRGDGVVLLAE